MFEIEDFFLRFVDKEGEISLIDISKIVKINTYKSAVYISTGMGEYHKQKCSSKEEAREFLEELLNKLKKYYEDDEYTLIKKEK